MTHPHTDKNQLLADFKQYALFNTFAMNPYMLIKAQEYQSLIDNATCVLNEVLALEGLKNNCHENLLTTEAFSPTVFSIDFAHTDEGFKLIELQAFSSIMHIVNYLYEKLTKLNFSIAAHFERNALIAQHVLGQKAPGDTVLLEFEPQRQKTLLDFEILKKHLGVDYVDSKDIAAIESKLFNLKTGKEIKRLYNRLIFSDMPEYEKQVTMNTLNQVNVQWSCHPNWYIWANKSCLNRLNHSCVPKTYSLEELPIKDIDWSKYVVKPKNLYSGQNLMLNPTLSKVTALDDVTQYLAQEKVKYARLTSIVPGLDLFAEYRVIFVKTLNGSFLPVLSFARVNDKPELNSAAFNQKNPHCGVYAMGID